MLHAKLGLIQIIKSISIKGFQILIKHYIQPYLQHIIITISREISMEIIHRADPSLKTTP